MQYWNIIVTTMVKCEMFSMGSCVWTNGDVQKGFGILKRYSIHGCSRPLGWTLRFSCLALLPFHFLLPGSGHNTSSCYLFFLSLSLPPGWAVCLQSWAQIITFHPKLVLLCILSQQWEKYLLSGDGAGAGQGLSAVFQGGTSWNDSQRGYTAFL